MQKLFVMIAMILGLNSLIPKVHAETNEKIHQIEQFIEEQMKVSQIPGLSIVIVEKGKTVY